MAIFCLFATSLNTGQLNNYLGLINLEFNSKDLFFSCQRLPTAVFWVLDLSMHVLLQWPAGNHPMIFDGMYQHHSVVLNLRATEWFHDFILYMLPHKNIAKNQRLWNSRCFCLLHLPSDFRSRKSPQQFWFHLYIYIHTYIWPNYNISPWIFLK